MALLLIAVATASAAASQNRGERAIESASTGAHAELLDSVAITKPTAPRIDSALALAPARVPSLELGDQLITNGELEVTTDCLAPSSRCAGHVYHYAPKVTASLALFDATTDLSVPVGESQEIRCLQRRPDRQHHCVLTFPTETTTIGAAQQGCTVDPCSLVLGVSATNRHAAPGDRLVLGSNRPDGSISSGHAGLGLIRVAAQSPVESEQTATQHLRLHDLPLNLEPRSVISIRLPRLRRGERLAIDAGFLSDVRRVGLNALVSSKLIIAEGPGDTRSRGLARRIAPHALAQDIYLQLRKAGLVSILRDAREGGERKPLFVNLVVRAKPKFNATGRRAETRLPISAGELSAVSYEAR